MYAVELDQSKRLLVISAVQRVTAAEAKLAAQRVRELLQDVVPGFRVLADFRWLDSMDSASARSIAEIRPAEQSGAVLVEKRRLGIDPNWPVAAAGRRRHCSLSARRSRGRWVGGRGTGCCSRSFRFE